MGNDLLAIMQALEDRRARLTVSGALDELGSLLSETLVYGHSTGTVDDKQSFLALIRNGVVNYQAIVPELDRAVRTSDHIVTISGLLHTHVLVGGQEKKISGRYVAMWSHDDDRWQFEAIQGSSSGN